MLCLLKKNQKRSTQYGDEVTFGNCEKEKCAWWNDKLQLIKCIIGDEEIKKHKSKRNEYFEEESPGVGYLYKHNFGCSIKIISESKINGGK